VLDISPHCATRRTPTLMNRRVAEIGAIRMLKWIKSAPRVSFGLAAQLRGSIASRLDGEGRSDAVRGSDSASPRRSSES
jgi:hypothetical protein